MASNPIKELDDVAILVIILAAIGFLFLGGLKFLKLFTGGGDANGITGSLASSLKAASAAGSNPTFSQVLNSPALPTLPESYGATLSNMAVDSVKGIGNFFSGIWYGLVGGVSGGSSNSNQSPQGGSLGGDAGQFVSSYDPLANIPSMGSVNAIS